MKVRDLVRILDGVQHAKIRVVEARQGVENETPYASGPEWRNERLQRAEQLLNTLLEEDLTVEIPS